MKRTNICPICNQELTDNDSKFTVFRPNYSLVSVHYHCVQKIMNNVIDEKCDELDKYYGE